MLLQTENEADGLWEEIYVGFEVDNKREKMYTSDPTAYGELQKKATPVLLTVLSSFNNLLI